MRAGQGNGDLRKLQLIAETVLSEAGNAASTPVTRAAAIAVFPNPFAGKYAQDLSQLIDLGMALGDELTPKAVALLKRAPVSYGKAAIVGVNGEMEHGAAVLHPKLGKPMRAAVGGGEAIIPSSCKVAAAGALIDVPLGNKDNVWSFDELDTLTVMVADSPRPDEIMLVIAVCDGGRIAPRIGRGRAVV
jgi:hypothetical protein